MYFDNFGVNLYLCCTWVRRGKITSCVVRHRPVLNQASTQCHRTLRTHRIQFKRHAMHTK